jgi:hypothetical protein
MITDALGRRPARLAFKVRFPKSNGRGRPQRRQYRGRWLRFPWLQSAAPTISAGAPERFVHREIMADSRFDPRAKMSGWRAGGREVEWLGGQSSAHRHQAAAGLKIIATPFMQ